MAQQITVKHLAAGLGVAAWLCLSYWLYATRIYPRLHRGWETSELQVMDHLPYPLAFAWGQREVIAGASFEGLKSELMHMDSLDRFAIVLGEYFLDEAPADDERQQLAQDRITAVAGLFRIPGERILTEVRQADIRADVRAYPFEAVKLRLLEGDHLQRLRADTAEVCFPLRETNRLPALLEERVIRWSYRVRQDPEARLVITGTADGTGIAESADVATDRADYVASLLAARGWDRDRLDIRAGQRNLADTLRNRCVVLWIER